MSNSLIKKFKDFKLFESNSHYLINPFMQSVYFFGGIKIDIPSILESERHTVEYKTIKSTDTSLLFSYSPVKKDYIISSLGQTIIDASNNPNQLYTIVIDGCENSKTIQMIDDELSQAISNRRNNFRFIILDTSVSSLFKDSNLEFKNGRIKIPENLGFVFISTDPTLVMNNDLLRNRLDFVELKGDENIETVSQLLEKRYQM
jgi:hypothetical protein